MASQQIRASTMGRRSPNQLIPDIMTNSENGASMFASFKSEDMDADEIQVDSEVHNITNYYSPINDDNQASSEPRNILNIPSQISIHSPIPDQLPRQGYIVENVVLKDLSRVIFLPFSAKGVDTYPLDISRKIPFKFFE